MAKPRVVKDFDKLSEDVLAQIKLEYPYGFQKELVVFKNKDGKLVSALPFQTEDKYYLIRMTESKANEIIEKDDDYDEDGILKDDAKSRMEDVLKDYEEE